MGRRIGVRGPRKLTRPLAAVAYSQLSVFGWLSLKEAEHYAREARRKKLAGKTMG